MDQSGPSVQEVGGDYWKPCRNGFVACREELSLGSLVRICVRREGLLGALKITFTGTWKRRTAKLLCWTVLSRGM